MVPPIIHIFSNFKILHGNDDRDTEKKRVIYDGILARWLRFVGKTSNNKFCMRTEVFGVKEKPGKTFYTIFLCI